MVLSIITLATAWFAYQLYKNEKYNSLIQGVQLLLATGTLIYMHFFKDSFIVIPILFVIIIWSIINSFFMKQEVHSDKYILLLSGSALLICIGHIVMAIPILSCIIIWSIYKIKGSSRDDILPLICITALLGYLILLIYLSYYGFKPTAARAYDLKYIGYLLFALISPVLVWVAHKLAHRAQRCIDFLYFSGFVLLEYFVIRLVCLNEFLLARLLSIVDIRYALRHTRNLLDSFTKLHNEEWLEESLFFFILVVIPIVLKLLVRYRTTALSRSTKVVGTALIINLLVCGGLVIGIKGAYFPTTFAMQHLPGAAPMLIKAGIGINNANSYGIKPLGVAIENNDVYMGRLLIENGADINTLSAGGHDFPHYRRIFWSSTIWDETGSMTYETMLMHAIHKGNTDMMRLLVEHGADVNLKVDSNTPLIYAIEYSTLETAKYLINNGAMISSATLRVAVRYGKADIVKWLLEQQYWTAAQKNEAFHEAVIGNPQGATFQTIAKTLLDHGADINVKENGKSYLVHTCEWGNEEKSKILIDLGIVVDDKALAAARIDDIRNLIKMHLK